MAERIIDETRKFEGAYCTEEDLEIGFMANLAALTVPGISLKQAVEIWGSNNDILDEARIKGLEMLLAISTEAVLEVGNNDGFITNFIGHLVGNPVHGSCQEEIVLLARLTDEGRLQAVPKCTMATRGVRHPSELFITIAQEGDRGDGDLVFPFLPSEIRSVAFVPKN